MKCPKKLELYTLDEIAETVSGVTSDESVEICEHIINDDRNPEEDWDPASWKECSPNNVENAWDRLPPSLQFKLVRISTLLIA
tara:strand:- start:463 stop:711 length:249 start_codon:yes stop_codon:yes gene_type:complete